MILSNKETLLNTKTFEFIRKEVVKMRGALDWIAKILVIVGGLNWGLVGAFDFDLVNALLGSISWLQNLVYILVGLSAIYMLYLLFRK